MIRGPASGVAAGAPPRRSDARFVLPQLPSSAAVDGAPASWEEGLRLAGCRTVLRSDSPDLVVASRSRLSQALRSGAPTVLVEGRVSGPPAGWSAVRWTIVLRRNEPVCLVPHGDRVLLQRGLLTWNPSGKAKARLRALALAAGSAGFPVALPTVTVLSRHDPRPCAVQLADRLLPGVPYRPMVLTGGGSERRRVTTLLYEPDATEPRWAVKTARHRGGQDRAVRELAALRALGRAAVGGVTVPEVVAWGELDGGQAWSVEQAASGRSLTTVAQESPERARAAVLRLVQWLQDVALATRSLAPGVASTAADQLRPFWPDAPLAEAAAALSDVPGVLTHGDLLAGDNVVIDGDRVSVLDWETFQPAGLPLLDVLPQLALTLAALRVGPVPADVAEEVVRCALGGSADSAFLRTVLHGYTVALGVVPSQLGPLAALAWAHHGAAPRRHRAALAQEGLPAIPWPSAPEEVARVWLAHPRLGVRWSALDA